MSNLANNLALSVLLERVHNSLGCDAELDTDLLKAANPAVLRVVSGVAIHEHATSPVQAYTGNLQSIVNLIRWRLPECAVEPLIHPRKITCRVWFCGTTGGPVSDEGKTPALAACAAFIRALADERASEPTPFITAGAAALKVVDGLEVSTSKEA